MKNDFSLSKRIAELEAVQAYFEQPNFDLEMAISKQAEAVKIAQEILAYLNTAESKIAILNIDEVKTETGS